MRGTNSLRLLAITCAAILITAMAGPAAAGPRDHADGFFLRLSAGGGSAKSTIEQGADEAEISGKAADLNVAIGGMVSPNWALHGTLFGWRASDPDLDVNGATGEINGDVSASGFGAGMTYYAMPVNLYLSGTIGTGKLSLDGPGNIDGDTDRGLFLDFTVGKEWWAGDNWGLGAALGVTYHSFNDPDIGENWSGTSFALRFTATMN